MLESAIDFLFDLLSLKSRKRGPLKIHAELQGASVQLTVQNQGKRELKFAAVQGHDSRQKRFFPQADLEVQSGFAANQTVMINLAVEELRAMDCQSLAVMDTSGHAWPVEGFDPATLG